MATVRDLSGNTNYLDTHIPTPGGSGGGGAGDASAANQLIAISALNSIDTKLTGVASDASVQEVVAGLEGITIDTSGLATEITLEAIRVAATSDNPVLVVLNGNQYEYIAPSSTGIICGTTGAVDDVLEGVWIVPQTTTPGAVSVEDGATNTVIYAGGVLRANIDPFFMPFGASSVSSGWKITTGTNVGAIPVGQFT